jgi:hypothetical protein
MLSQKLRIRCKTWAKKGKGFWQSFLILLLVFQMRPQDLFLYEKKMVIRFGDGLQWVKWLGSPL